VKKLGIFTLSLLFLAASARPSAAWDDDVTHRDLSKFAAEHSVLGGITNQIVSSGGIQKQVYEWIQDGAEQEDAADLLFPLLGTARFFNHFHDPLESDPWTAAGLHSPLFSGESALLWAQDPTGQAGTVGGDWSWQRITDYRYFALTATDDATYQDYLAKMFMGLGHQMHLVQDMAVPAHVRNDPHPEDAVMGRLGSTAFFEAWAASRRYRPQVAQFAAVPEMPALSFDRSPAALSPVALLFDTDTYDGTAPSAGTSQGLAEYTNANFVSADTIFSPDYPFPSMSETDIAQWESGGKLPETITAEDGVEDRVFYIEKTGAGQPVTHFLKPTYHSRDVYDIVGGGTIYERTFKLDENCHKEYASHLVPRAVGYSAALVDYFFRGQIEIKAPDTGYYSLIPGTATGFTSLSLLARNATSNNEEMPDGTIELALEYKVALSDHFAPVQGAVPTTAEFTYTVVPEESGIRSLSRTGYTLLSFDLSANPIPLWATDVYIIVFYRGILGNDLDAIAAGSKDISEPTPVDLLSSMDYVCLNDSWYGAGSPEAIAVVDTDNDGDADLADVYAHGLGNVRLRFSRTDKPARATATVYDHLVPYIAPGEFHRAVYLLGDSWLYGSVYRDPDVRVDPYDPWTPWEHTYQPPADLFLFPTIRRQGSQQNPPPFWSFRGRNFWYGKWWAGEVYPSGSSCDPNALPAAVTVTP